ncbi:MAG: phenylacetate-CoA oxygenase subunit PaaC [Actinomycetota bacterium]|nr:phenylacetate-CoA oxygenase subunit PaaC [Actinomycetota bacterium]
MTLSPAAREVLLALADDELLIGHRHSEWLGLAPFLEEDLAFATIAQDELGHARGLYELMNPGAVDELAFGRQADDYRCAWLVELPGHPWEAALVRHVIYDMAEEVRWRALLQSSVPGLAELAAKALREEEYHRRHGVPVLQRMFIGNQDSRRRIRRRLDELLPLALALFEPSEGEDQAVWEGVLAAPMRDLEQEWRGRLEAVMAEVAEDVIWPEEPQGLGARRGRRSPHFSEAMETMTAVLGLDPQASW